MATQAKTIASLPSPNTLPLKSDSVHVAGGSSAGGPQDHEAFEAALSKADYMDYVSWVTILESADKVNILLIRKAFDAFLARFPLCYRQWKQYADYEWRVGSKKVVEVYERSIRAAPYSVPIWCNYCLFLVSSQEEPDKIRRQFEKGLTYVGTDYRSNILWDEYIKFEVSQQNWSNVANIYATVLKNPIQDLNKYFLRFLDTIDAHKLNIHIDLDGSVKPGCSNEATLKQYSTAVENSFKRAKEYMRKLICFEQVIKRTCFSIEPLDDSEIDNWHKYLNFMEAQEDLEKVSAFYERCLIACACYSEFWIRYVNYLSDNGKIEAATYAVHRGTNIFVKEDVEFHMFSARFKASNGDIIGARQGYKYIYSELCPGMIQAIFRHANLELRQGSLECAVKVYEQAIASGKQNQHSQNFPSLLIQYAKFLSSVVGDYDKTKDILSMLMQGYVLNKQNIKDVIWLETSIPGEKRIEFVAALIKKFLTPEPSDDMAENLGDKEETSTEFIKFLDSFGTSQQIREANSRHRALFSCKRNILPLKKHKATDDQYEEAALSSQPCKKRSRAENAVVDSPPQLATKEAPPQLAYSSRLNRKILALSADQTKHPSTKEVPPLSAKTTRLEENKCIAVSEPPTHLQALTMLSYCYDSGDDDYGDASVT